MNHHPTLYFSDGSLVIVCKSHEETPTYFRVHKTIMARHSPVFADMLTVPSPPDNQDVYDGVPLVEFPDDPKDVTIFLKFFYEPFTSLISDTDPAIAFNMSGVLKLADRLLVEPLKQAILTRIRLDWPLTLEEWDARREFYQAGNYPDPAQVIQFACPYDSSLLVPSLYYELSIRNPGYARCDLISENDQVIARHGRARMLDWLRAQMFSWTWSKQWECNNLPDKEWADRCTDFQLRQFIKTHHCLLSDADILRVLSSPIGQNNDCDMDGDYMDGDYMWLEESILCRPCASASDDRWRTMRNDLFENLPEFFSDS